MAKCCYCGKQMSIFSLNCLPMTTKVNGQRMYECRDCYKKYKGKMTQFYADGTAVVMEDKDTEIRKRCNVCGHLYCYSLYDVERNKERAKSAIVAGVAGIANVVGGAYTASAVQSANADNALNGIVDYSRCPHCGSMDVRTLSKDEWAAEQAKAAQGSALAPAVSAADELKKFKDLLDSGAITQEEFDAKKKQLLNL